MTVPVTRLLDTNVVSEMMRPEPAPQVAEFLDAVAADGIGLSCVTVWEILNGIGRLDHGQRRSDITERFQGMLDDVFEDRVFGWTAADAQMLRLWKQSAAKESRSIAICRMR